MNGYGYCAERISAAPGYARAWSVTCKLVSLPTVLREGPYRFFFYSADRDEPPHVHIERDEASAKFWLDPVRFERSQGFGRAEIKRLERVVGENREHLLRSWNEYFEH